MKILRIAAFGLGLLCWSGCEQKPEEKEPAGKAEAPKAPETAFPDVVMPRGEAAKANAKYRLRPGESAEARAKRLAEAEAD
jgi:PBP1b-binding outer membrane lipoprotein LpoB